MRLGRKWAVVGVVLTLVGVIVGVVGWRSRDPWPARLVLKQPKNCWPLGFSSDGRWYQTQDQQQVTSWDVTTGRTRQTPTVEWIGDKTLSKDQRIFAGLMVDGSRNPLVVWGDATTGEVKARFPIPSRTAHHPSLVDEDRKIRVFLQAPNDALEVATWDIASGAEAKRAIQGPGAGYYGPVAYFPDGRTLAYLDRKRDGIQLWDAEADRPTGGLLRTPATGRNARLSPDFGILFSPDGRTLIADGGEGRVEFWDMADFHLIKALKLHPRGYTARVLKISPDGRTLTSTGCVMDSPSGIARIWEIARTLLTGLGTHEASVETVVVDLNTDRPLVRLPGSAAWGFSPDGRTIATYDVKETISLRDAPRPEGR